MKKAIITGITGQDGSYLAEHLLSQGYEVHGFIRNAIHSSSLVNIVDIRDRVKLHICSLNNFENLITLLTEIQADELYHLAGQTHIKTSFDMPTETMDINAVGTLRILEAVRMVSKYTKVFLASSVECFDFSWEDQREYIPKNPTSIYACSKLSAYYLGLCYRNVHNLFVGIGVLGTHESPRRPDTFVTRKITKAAARIKLGLQESLTLGNIENGRDWGASLDFVDGMWRTLQHETPETFTFGTNSYTTIREWLDWSFKFHDLNYKDYVISDKSLFRPGDKQGFPIRYELAKNKLGWEPQITTKELCSSMSSSDLIIERSQVR